MSLEEEVVYHNGRPRRYTKKGVDLMKHGIRLIAFALLVAFTLTGCSWKQVLGTVGLAGVAAGGVAGYYYLEGDLEADIDDDIDDVYYACLKALDDEGWDIEDKDLNDEDAKIVAEKGDDTVTLKLKEKDDDETHLSIRVGTFGDEEKSEDLLDAIEDRL
jgi:hypothetical protein